MDAPLTHRVGQGILGQFHTALGGIQIRFCQQDDEGGDATDHQGIEIHTQGLDQALLGGVGHRSRGSGVGDRAHTRFIGEQATTDTLHDHRTEGGTGEFTQAEGVGHN